MNDLKSIFEFIRIRDQIFIVLAVLIGNFLHSFTLDVAMLTLLAFIFSLVSFTFVINNISDVKIDRLNKKSENSITRKEISLSFAKFLLILFLLLSIIFAFLLPGDLFYLSLILILISLTYSFFIKAKSRPPLDLIYHGLSPAIVFIMISSFYVQFDLAILFSSIISCSFW